MQIFTIGFTKKSAEEFFSILRAHGIRRLIDVRLHNVSQLTGFSKREDLQYFLRELCHAEYVHEPLLAPTQEMLDKFKKQKGDWAEYEKQFLALLVKRKIEDKIELSLFAVPAVLLCSEPTAEHCHRRLVVEYLRERWGNLAVQHL